MEFSNGDVITHEEIFNYIPPLNGTTGDDILEGGFLPDQINGFAGNDSISAYSGDDTISAGTGNDLIKGGYGNDTYLYNIGDGQDTIFDTTYSSTSSNHGANDTIKFGEGITFDNIDVTAIDRNIIITMKDAEGNLTDDKIILEHQLYNSHKIEIFEFSDGTVLSHTDIINLIQPITGTENNDSLAGSNLNEEMNGLAGDDSLSANRGDDTISGGTGNDLMKGGYGNDTYLYNIGDGQDTIFDTTYSSTSSNHGANDTIKFGEGITVDNIVVTAHIEDVTIAVKDAEGNLTDDKIILEHQLYNSHKIETFEFTDGSVLNYTDIINLIPPISGTESNDSLEGSWLSEEMNGLAGDDSLSANRGDDTISAGTGNDLIKGGYGNDTYLYNIGDGQDTIFDTTYSSTSSNHGANDTIKFGEGITFDNIDVTAIDRNIIITMKDAEGNLTDDKIILEHQLYNSHKIEIFEFSDGTRVKEN